MARDRMTRGANTQTKSLNLGDCYLGLATEINISSYLFCVGYLESPGENVNGLLIMRNTGKRPFLEYSFWNRLPNV